MRASKKLLLYLIVGSIEFFLITGWMILMFSGKGELHDRIGVTTTIIGTYGIALGLLSRLEILNQHLPVLNELTSTNILEYARANIIYIAFLPLYPLVGISIIRSWLFNVYSFKDRNGLVLKLKNAEDPVSRYIKAHMSSDITQILRKYDGYNYSPDLFQKLTEELNSLLRDKTLYNKQRFERVELTGKTQKLINEKPQEPQDEDIIRLNRLLLEDAYPREIAKSRSLLAWIGSKLWYIVIVFIFIYLVFHILLVAPLAYVPLIFASALLEAVRASPEDFGISDGHNSPTVKQILLQNEVSAKGFIVGIPALAISIFTSLFGALFGKVT